MKTYKRYLMVELDVTVDDEAPISTVDREVVETKRRLAIESVEVNLDGFVESNVVSVKNMTKKNWLMVAGLTKQADEWILDSGMVDCK